MKNRQYVLNSVKIKVYLIGLIMPVINLCYAQPGVIDPTFGNIGKVQTNLKGNDLANAIVILPDDKILVCGTSGVVSGTSDFALIRYLKDGNIDSTFGVDGKVFTDFGNSFSEEGTVIALLKDGKIIIGGNSFNGGSGPSPQFALLRYHANGTLDSTFGSNGKVRTNFGFNTHGYSLNSMLVKADGKILVSGNTYDGGGEYDFLLAQYNQDGSIDNTFGNSGKVYTGYRSIYDHCNSMVVQADGKIIIAGDSYNKITHATDIALLRYKDNGVKDSTFGINGSVITDLRGNDVAFAVNVQPDQKIVVSGATNSYPYDFFVLRYDASGSIDSTFGSNGKTIIDFVNFSNDVPRSMLLQQDGKIVVAGFSEQNFAIARYNQDGTLDHSFNSTGKATTDFGGAAVIESIAVQSNNQIVAAGVSGKYPYSDFTLARYNYAASSTRVRDLQHKFNIYPNPFSNRLTINTDINSSFIALISDNTGKVILQQKLQNGEFVETEKLSQGIYILSIMQKQEILGRQKIVKE